MANYDTTVCYIFETEDVVRKIFSEIIEDKGTEKLLDMNKIKPVPENISKEDFPKWVVSNWGSHYYIMFEYRIYEGFSRIELEGKYSVFPNLFENLSKNFSVSVLILYNEEGMSGNGLLFIDPNKGIRISYDIIQPDSFANINAINFQALGVEQDIYSCLRYRLSPIERDGCSIARQHIKQEEIDEADRILKVQTIQDSSKDGEW